ncbi:MAG: 4Fe-4S dicluster domain-containing protein [Chloroflexi bacterium]|nr:4Fe-4S dicluster domain-containing protein [Chloroflexota bacterium]
MARGVAVIGNSVGAAQCALNLVQMGAEVSLIVSTKALSLDGNGSSRSQDASANEQFRIWPLLLRAATHPGVKLYTNSCVEAVTKKRGQFNLKVKKLPRYVDEKLCTSCGQCQEACPVKIPFSHGSLTLAHGAIHAPLVGIQSIPAAYSIDKNDTAPCRAACPLGINVPGFICLLAKGKADEALNLINEAAPLAGILGRVCSHPCEDDCQRAKVDSPVFIQALHRYAADNASGSINYNRRSQVKPREEKIAIVGSGPSGLAAAWELARRGYMPTIFESHAVVGGMLATGIPRFRLPREVREREVEAVKAMGVDIKTGVIVGRDITLSDLREQGYRAFYLAIGAGLNNKLNIPGEDLEGVVDVISMLFALNLKVGATVGSNVVVIGGGNSAVDSARAVKRRSKGTVRILYRRTSEEMTAIKDHVEEALEEGVLIDYLTVPVEIIGDGAKVTGIRCQRMKLGKVDATGRRQPVPIEGSEFTIDADHVVVAIGQRPSTGLLRLKDIKLNDDATISVDPLTLQTNIPDIFAGGDCITGPNTVVEAMAAGLRAAESIDRYLGGRDLRKDRSLESPEPVEVDIKERYVSPQKRTKMPTLPHADRMGSFEETNRGLSAEVSKLEAERCLSCAFCSGCLECERVCQVSAVSHKDTIESVKIEAGAVVNFISNSGTADLSQSEAGQGRTLQISDPGIFVVEAESDGDLWDELSRASAIALDIAQELKLREKTVPTGADAEGNHDGRLNFEPETMGLVGVGDERTGVVLCRCGGSISSIINLSEVVSEIQRLPGVSCVQELSQICTEYGAQEIKTLAAEEQLSRLVVAACRCCNLEQVCFSCTEQRVRCQGYLSRYLGADHSTVVEFVNIREQCAWVHSDNPAEATHKAIEIVSSGVVRAQDTLPVILKGRPITEGALVISTGLSGLATAIGLASQAYSVALIYKSELKRKKGKQPNEYLEKEASLLKELVKLGISVMTWPRTLRLDGVPGNYEAILEYPSETANIKAGAVIVDTGALDKILAQADATFKTSLVGRILAWNTHLDNRVILGFTLREFAIGDPTGIFIVSSSALESPEKQVIMGRAMAARVSSYLSQGMLRPRVTAVDIDRQLCRGCGDCAAVCPYIEMKICDLGTAYAVINPMLCLGCGACITSCPTGAITQLVQNDLSIISTLEAQLKKSSKVGVAT